MDIGLLATIIAALAIAGGIIMLAVAIPGTDEKPETAKGITTDPMLLRRIAFIAGGFALGLIATRLMPVALIGAGAGYLIVRGSSEKKARSEHQELTAAMSEWLEQLRDAVAADGVIEGALRRTASSGPELLQARLQLLNADLLVYDIETALERFAAQVNHHIADIFAVAYRTAATDSTRGLVELLTALADTARDEAETYRTIGTERKKIESNSRLLTVLMAIFGAVILAVGRTLIAVYAEPQGQILLLIFGLAALGLWNWRLNMSRIEVPPRVFAVKGATV
jgi:hypothetical protein